MALPYQEPAPQNGLGPVLDGRDTICGSTQMLDPLALGGQGGTEFSDAQAPRPAWDAPDARARVHARVVIQAALEEEVTEP